MRYFSDVSDSFGFMSYYLETASPTAQAYLILPSPSVEHNV